jgi:hypothetical protein
MTSILKDEKRILVVQEQFAELGKSEIVKFAVDYAFERQKIQIAVYIDLGMNKGMVKPNNILDEINLDLHLDL